MCEGNEMDKLMLIPLPRNRHIVSAEFLFGPFEHCGEARHGFPDHSVTGLAEIGSHPRHPEIRISDEKSSATVDQDIESADTVPPHTPHIRKHVLQEQPVDAVNFRKEAQRINNTADELPCVGRELLAHPDDLYLFL